ncbi:family 10 glycosylhydrolase [Akkermansiaceae bacterium]|nr:family 10 glycosylhydrolase [Akkermansiaceae bacterium]MDB4478272.1 family 10 glycosylhydrolase [Akkermansiaceae bacterium]MDB4481336.1 family 10 glycosylhydrolase [Akkermansiaceae bacterium]
MFSGLSQAQQYSAVNEVAPMVPREFRAAWVACVYNIDWPSRKGMGAGAQQAEMKAMLDRMASMKMNAIIFQVRPNADAVYQSRLEPWSHWISGTQGLSPGYDPLAYCIQQAHARGIEVHAWFNPFRALPNSKIPTARNHVVKTHPSVIRDFKNYKWMDPSNAFTQQRALSVILDVVNRYDVDGIHIDDYFYPYPDVDSQGRAKPIFPDGKTPAARRAASDGFVKAMYSKVKAKKPWVRVGISPFGIWRPGVPAGTTATIDAYHHLAADSLKWLQHGWCDYLSPQLYWRIKSPQSFSRLIAWWRSQGARPVWPGIASARINSSEDPGRRASEIANQVSLTRTVGKNYVGHVFWSMKSLMTNKGGISNELVKKFYQEPALVPPMPWSSRNLPQTPNVLAKGSNGNLDLVWRSVPGCSQYAIQVRVGRAWRLITVVRGTKVTLKGLPDAIAVSAVDRYGNTSNPRVLARP